ncbi:MAG TPA: hypothetical protein VK631_20710 [Solirubrobacteraceae bacterium]|nr:hypothetical protein [Solirubrobacteraceae bacterium]
MISQRLMVAASLAAVHHPDVYRHAAPAPKPKPGPHCVNGIVTDLNGAQWKCSFCGGVPTPRTIPGTNRTA